MIQLTQYQSQFGLHRAKVCLYQIQRSAVISLSYLMLNFPRTIFSLRMICTRLIFLPNMLDLVGKFYRSWNHFFHPDLSNQNCQLASMKRFRSQNLIRDVTSIHEAVEVAKPIMMTRTAMKKWVIIWEGGREFSAPNNNDNQTMVTNDTRLFVCNNICLLITLRDYDG